MILAKAVKAGKVVGIVLAIIAVSVLAWNLPMLMNTSSNGNSANANHSNNPVSYYRIETFQVPISLDASPAKVYRHIFLMKGQTATGSWTTEFISAWGNESAGFVEAIFDRQGNELQACWFDSIASQMGNSFSLVASQNTSYSMVFAYITMVLYPSNLPTALKVTLSYEIVG